MQQTDLDWLIKRVWRRPLSESEAQALARAWELKAFDAGSVLIEEGKPGGKLWLLRSGLAEIQLDRGGRSLRIATAREGALVGEMSFLSDAPASATVVAAEPVSAYGLARDAALGLMREHPELMLGLFAYMLAHHAETVRRMNEEFFQLYDYLTGTHK